MTDAPRERRRHHRTSAQSSRRWPVQVRVAGEAWRPAIAASVSVGGVFVMTARPAAVGAAVEVELPVLGAGRSVVVPGVVRRVASPDAAEPGMAIAFGATGPDAVLALTDYLAAASGIDGGW